MNICARCDQPILHGEAYDRVDMHANSGGQFDVLRHLVCPGRTTDRAPARSPRTGRAAPRPTYPATSSAATGPPESAPPCTAARSR
ncbi:hypothetical protein C0Q60_12200 [Streptomyces albidoflavus]|nr:hypothetical protein C0Q60_12200 [Streptomyces albidoflavus]RZD99108.1 hypothetical protein C0Q62_12090 [Streptomyces albidoflavus]